MIRSLRLKWLQGKTQGNVYFIRIDPSFYALQSDHSTIRNSGRIDNLAVLG